MALQPDCLPRNHGIKFILSAAVLAALWMFYRAANSVGTLSAHIPSSLAPTSPSPRTAFPIPPNNNDVADLCARHRLKPFSPVVASSSPDITPPRRKIYDLLLVNTELEMLELRLAQMYPHVDHFIVLESPVTFTNQPKPLHVLENWARFAPYHDKLIRHTLDTKALGFAADTDAWTRERASRNALFSQVVPGLQDPRAAAPGDVLLVSDVDEIPKPATLAALRACAFPPRTALASHMYFYSFQWLSSEDWPRPHATFYRGENDTVMPQDLRGGNGASEGETFRMESASWHCSYCFDSFRQLINKLESFSHQELNRPEFKDPKAILERVRLGKDFYDRSDRVYHYIEENHDVPEVLKRNPRKYKHLLDRTPSDGNFADYHEFFGPAKSEVADTRA